MMGMYYSDALHITTNVGADEYKTTVSLLYGNDIPTAQFGVIGWEDMYSTNMV